MKSKSSLLVNLAYVLVPVIFFHLCLHNTETKTFGMSFVWGLLIAVALVRRYLVVGLGLLAVVTALLVSKQVRLPQKFVQATLCLIFGYTAGALWFISHTSKSDFFPLQE